METEAFAGRRSHSLSMTYETTVQWTGNRGEGTRRYDSYERSHEIAVRGKSTLWGSADERFRGDGTLHNPEDLFVAAIAACHMLTYLALCARRGVSVIEYIDRASGSLQLHTDGSGAFREIVLRPTVVIEAASDAHRATQLHEEAHRLCFLARSCAVPIRVEARVESPRPVQR